MHDLSTTVVAVATPGGRGGVGCLRISGPDALSVARRLFRPGAGDTAPRPGGPPRFGRFVTRDGRALDHGYLVVFPAGASFSGDLTAELWSHGSPPVLAELVQGALDAGAQPASPGEFTYRALRNGRLDLTRAEAVRDLVEARTLFQARVAFAQAEGSVSRRLQPVRERLERCIARGEAAVEFVDESETHLPPGTLAREIDASRRELASLLDGFRTGRVVRDGAKLAMIGLPNAGKSSLFNRLLQCERAIVHEVAGTTRDTLEEQIDLDGIPARLVDTAGLREVVDPIESEGVRRAHRARDEADLVLLVLDASREPEPLERQALGRAADDGARERTIVVLNKCDLDAAAGRVVPGAVRVSARTGAGIEGLRAELRRRLVGNGPLEDPVITNGRHSDALRRALASLERAAHSTDAGFSEELLLEDLREAIGHVGTITGEFTQEDLYDRIFSTFCIGK